jgi:acyl-CoA thioesterase I
MGCRSISWFLLGLFTLALILQPAGAGAQAPQRGVYLALGDSLAVGVGATNPAQLGYVPRLFNFFHGTAHAGVDTLLNVGVPGATSTTFISGGQLANALAAIEDLTTDIRVVTLDIGGNDLLALLEPGSPCLLDPNVTSCQVALATALDTFARNYAFILGELTAKLAADPGDEVILVMTYYNHLSGTSHPFETTLDLALLGRDLKIDCGAAVADPRNRGLNDIIACAGGPGVVVADVYPRFVGKGPTLTHVQEGGDFHPTNAGYAMIANIFMRASR